MTYANSMRGLQGSRWSSCSSFLIANERLEHGITSRNCTLNVVSLGSISLNSGSGRLSLAEEVLKSIAEGCTDREVIVRRHWPSDTQEKAASKLKNMLQDLRRKYLWLQLGTMQLTVQGFEKSQLLL